MLDGGTPAGDNFRGGEGYIVCCSPKRARWVGGQLRRVPPHAASMFATTDVVDTLLFPYLATVRSEPQSHSTAAHTMHKPQIPLFPQRCRGLLKLDPTLPSGVGSGESASFYQAAPSRAAHPPPVEIKFNLIPRGVEWNNNICGIIIRTAPVQSAEILKRVKKFHIY